MDACQHYIGLPTALRHPVTGERFKSAPHRTAVCPCGVCLGWLRVAPRREVRFNPILNAAQRDSVHRFLTGKPLPVDA